MMELDPTDWVALEIKAAQFAADQHRGQVDLAGAPYITHCERVAKGCTTPAARVAAWLHDTLEDTGATALELREQGFPAEVIAAVQLLTKPRNDKAFPSYQHFIVRLSVDPIAVEVKLADLRDNMRIERIPNPTERDHKRIAKYRKALAFLLSWRYIEAEKRFLELAQNGAEG